MLIDLTIRNWKSYRDEATFSLLSSRERIFGASLSSVKGFRSLKILPLGSIYGGNASGKTGLFQALSFIQKYVVAGANVGDSIPVDPFRLYDGISNQNVGFDITFFSNERIYRLEFEVDGCCVHQERLSILRDRSDDIVLYDRHGQHFDIADTYFEAPDRVRFVCDGTRSNQLFLTNAALQNIAEVADAFYWFRDVLTMVGVSSAANLWAAYATRRDFLDFASNTLAKLDTGIHDVIGEDVDPAMLNLPPFVLNGWQAQASSNPDADFAMVVTTEQPGDYTSDMYFVTAQDNKLQAKRIKTRHRTANGSLVPFTLQMESSGSRRLINLMPMLFTLIGGFKGVDKVYVVDELDRCFHSMLTKKLLEEFARTCGPDSRRQLLFTTHDLLLMDQDVMRRDEMFITERDGDGCSRLIRLDEYAGLRADKDLLRSYLDGRFGGVPMFA